MGGRCADGEYARFLEATLHLADAAAELPRRARFGLTVALFRVCESDREACRALALHEPRPLERAAATLGRAREELADAVLSLAA